MASISSWSELPQDLLRLVYAGIAFPADCARFRAVCRSWHSVPPTKHRAPWVVTPAGFLMRTPDYSCKLIPFPENHRCVGSTDSWLVMDFTNNAQTRTHTYTLENCFSKTVLPFPELDTVIGNVCKPFEVRKVLMRSPPGGLVALRTNKYGYPIILVQPGKGIWLPQPREIPYTRLIDIAFLDDKLYGLTRDEDLFSFRIAFRSNGAPTVTGVECIVKHSTFDHEHPLENLRMSIIRDNNIEYNGMRYDDHESINGVLVVTIWYLVESRGKLLMVRRQLQGPEHAATRFTRKVEVFEADASTRTWVPVSGGLDGHALFMSKRFSKSVIAGGDVVEDNVHFMETGEAFNMRSKITAPPIFVATTHATCLFLPGALDSPIRY